MRTDGRSTSATGNAGGSGTTAGLGDACDGLAGSWHIDRNGDQIRFVWVNPPYDNPAAWVDQRAL